MKDLRGKIVAVAGMGKSGLAAAELLLAQGARVIAIDERSTEKLGATAQKLETWNVPLLPQVADSFAATELIVLSPGVPVDLPAVAQARTAGIPIIGEVELASFFLKGPVVGITGANGKTTTTAMTGHVLKSAGIDCQVGGNIGTPPTAMIQSSNETRWNVLELSSFQLETIEHFHANIGIAMNVTPDHLDRHYTFENYVNAKGRLFDTQHRGDRAVLNADDAACVSYASRTPGEVSWFSTTRAVSPGAYLESGNLMLHGEVLMDAASVPLRGIHNIENTLAVAVACKLAGASTDAIREGVKTFPGVEHRLEFVRSRNGVEFYNDSKATNVDATIKALDAFPGNLWIILGGKDKDSDYTLLRDRLQAKARRILLIGAAAEKIEQQLAGLRTENVGTIEHAVERSASQAVAGDVVLLAPACASFDQFQSFEHRGRVFKELVKAL